MKNINYASKKDCIRYMIRNWWTWEKKSVILCFIRIPILIVLPIVTSYIPKLLIDCINKQVTPQILLYFIALFSLIIVGLNWIGPVLSEYIAVSAQNVRMRYRIELFNKVMTIKYSDLENPRTREKLSRAKDFVGNGKYSGSQDFFEVIIQLLVNILGTISYSIIVLVKVNWLLVIFMLITGVLDYLILIFHQKHLKVVRNQVNLFWMKEEYLFKKSCDFKAGKDIRIYNFSKLFKEKSVLLLNSMIKLLHKYTLRVAKINILRASIILFRDIITYVVLIYLLLKKSINISDFIFYFSIVTGYSIWISGITNQLDNLDRICIECISYCDFMKIKENFNSKLKSKSDADIDLIEFKNVNFSYQKNSENFVLNNLNMKISKDQKIALVGSNGAGKTTCIKLLCEFYYPQSGEIILTNNEKRVDTVKISAVFQDPLVLPMSIAENIALCNEHKIDFKRLEYCINLVGLTNKISNLSHGYKTNLIKGINADAINLSGGEIQRLMIARAIYHKSNLIILDEPTSALDPLAEYEIYKHYQKIIHNTTSIMISHRLASTQFCDIIFYLDNGRIVESGTHEQLMALNGEYKRMYYTQSQYYKDGEVK